MAFGASRQVKDLRSEILKFPAGQDAIESVVLDASEAEELASALTGKTGVLGLRAGTILTQVDGDSQKRYKKYEAAGSEEVAGVLAENHFFYDDTDISDQPAAMLFNNCVFDSSKIIDFDTHEADVREALYNCRFD